MQQKDCKKRWPLRIASLSLAVLMVIGLSFSVMATEAATEPAAEQGSEVTASVSAVPVAEEEGATGKAQNEQTPQETPVETPAEIPAGPEVAGEGSVPITTDPAPSVEEVTVASFNALPEEVANRTVNISGGNTSQEALGLPVALTGTNTAEAPITIEGVTWQCSPAFDGAATGDYTFTAVLPSGFVLAEGVVPPTIQVKIVAISVRATTFTALFDGIDITTGSSSITTSYAEATRTRTLSVTDSFPGASAEKKLEVTIANGFKLDMAPGMVQAGAEWTFNTAQNPLPVDLQGVIIGAVWEKDAPINGRQPASGKLVYTLNATTTNLNIAVGISADVQFMAYEGAQTFTNPVQVETTVGGAPQSTARLNTAVIETTNFFWVYHQAVYPVTTAEPGQSYELVNHFGFFSGGGYAPSWLHGEVKLKFRIQKGAGATSGYAVNIGGNDLYEVSAIDKTSDPNFDFITFTFKPKADLYCATMVIKGTVPDDAPRGQVYYTNFITEDSYVTRWDGTLSHGTHDNGLRQLYIPQDGNTLYAYAVPQSIYREEISAPAEQRILGMFSITNGQNKTLDGRRARLEFKDAAIGVQGVRLMTGDKVGGARDIVVKSNLGNTYEIASVAAKLGGDESPSVSWYADLNMRNVEGWNKDTEYITFVEYAMGPIAPGSRTRTDLLYGSALPSMAYFGKLLQTPASYSAEMSILIPKEGVANPDYHNPDDWTPEKAETPVVKQTTNLGTAGAKTDLSVQTWSANAGPATPMVAGAEAYRTIGVEFDPYSYRYGASLSSYKGITLYVREAPGTSIKPSSVHAVWGYQDGSNKKYPYTATFRDNTGSLVYKIEIPDEIFGYDFNTHYGAVTANAEIRAINTAPTSSVPLKDIFFFQANDVTGTYRGWGNTTATRTDDFDFGVPNQSLAVPPTSSSNLIRIEANKDFAVATSADKGDGDWKVYQNGVPETVINLNTNLKARYRLSMVNNSGAGVIGGFSTIIPIPKQGENTGNTSIQTENFGWSMVLKEELSLPAPYTVRYAEGVYPTTVDDAAWKEFSAVSDINDVWAMMISRNDELDTAFHDEFWFELGIPTAEEVEAGNLQGATNIYRALVLASVNGNAAYRPSAPVALRINNGIIEGSVQLDNDRSASFSDGDTPVKGVTITAYEAGTSTIVEQTTAGDDGTFKLIALAGDQAVDLVFTNPGTGVRPMRYVLSATNALAENTAWKMENVMPSTNAVTSPVNVLALLQEPWRVTFNLPEGSSAVMGQKVYEGNKATEPVAPGKTGHSFGGWFADSGYTGAWSFASAIHANTTIYGKMNPDPIAVNYMLNNGTDNAYTEFSNQAAATATTYGSGVASPAENPVRTGYTFHGWFTSKEAADDYAGHTAFSFGSALTANATLWAAWELVNYNITYAMPSGSENPNAGLTSYTIEALEPNGIALQAPSRPGYTFTNWQAVGGTLGAITLGGSENNIIPTGTADDLTITPNWSANQYHVTFNANSGTGTMAGQNVTFDAATTLSTNAFAKEGHSFIGWNTDQNATTALYANEANFTWQTAGDVTLYAIWQANGYTVSFRANGGTGTMADQTVVFGSEVALPTNSFSRTGYTFMGWNTDAGATSATYADGAAYTQTAAINVTLYAVWRLNTYTIAYVLPEGSENPNAGLTTYTVEALEPSGITLQAPSRPGHTFTGWQAVGGTLGTITLGGAENNIIPTGTADNLTLTAGWDVNQYTLSFETNGGTGTMADQTVAFGSEVALPTNSFSRTGYTFMGWDTDAGATSATYADGAAYTQTAAGNVTLHAVWSLNTYTIAYVLPEGSENPNAGLTTYTVEALEPSGITLQAPSRAGYTFTGWQAVGGTLGAITLGGAENNIIPTGTADDLTLTAGWSVNQYTLSFEANGGTGTMTDQTVAFGSEVALPTNSFSRTGYTFMGWDTDAGATSATYADGAAYTQTAAGNVTLHAVWSLNTYTIAYVLPEGSENPNAGLTTYTVEALEPSGITLQAPSRAGYTFTGWQAVGGILGTITLGGAENNIIPTGTADNLTLTAGWSANQYALIFDANSGTGTMPNQNVTFDAATTLDALQFTNTGHTFIGWNTDPEATSALFADEGAYTQTVADDVTLYAIWSQNSYNVYFNGNGAASGSMDALQVGFGDTITLPENAFARTGYTFKGWGKAPNATEAAFTDAGDYRQDVDEAVTLYAVWEANKYTLTFNAQGGIPAPEKQTVVYGTKAIKPAKAPEKTGYSFIGWFDAAAGGNLWNFDEAAMPAKDVTLYAQYIVISYNVTFNFGGAPIEAHKETVDFGALVPMPPVPEWAGHTFAGWQMDDGKTLWDFAKNTMPAGNLALTAVWEQITYNVQFVDWDGTVLKTEKVAWNEDATPPTNPVRDGYTFTGWNGNYVNVTKEETVTATYSKNPDAPASSSSSSSQDTSQQGGGGTNTPQNSTSSSSKTTKPAANSATSSQAVASSASSGASSSSANSTATASESGKSSSKSVASQGGTTSISGESPLVEISANKGWGVSDVAMAFASVLCSIFLVVKSLRMRGKEGGNGVMMLLRALSIVLGAVSLVLLLALNNFSGAVSVATQWTPLLFGTLAVQAVIGVVQEILVHRNARG